MPHTGKHLKSTGAVFTVTYAALTARWFSADTDHRHRIYNHVRSAYTVSGALSNTGHARPAQTLRRLLQHSHPQDPEVCGSGSQSPQDPAVFGVGEPVPPGTGDLRGRGASHPRNRLSVGSGSQSPQERVLPAGSGSQSPPGTQLSAGSRHQSPPGTWQCAGSGNQFPANAERQTLLIYGLSLDCRLPEGQVCVLLRTFTRHI